MDSNCAPLVSEATALPTEPQPLPNWLEITPYYDSRVVIYERKMFIRLATGDGAVAVCLSGRLVVA